jgi:hypothetical protein
MSFWTGRVTVSGTGNNAFTGVGFQPTWIRIRVSKKNGTTETCSHLCLGATDGTNMNCSYIYSDSTSSKTDDFNTKLISHWERVAGTLTEILACTLTSFDADGFTINASTASANYKVTVECGN